MALPVALMRGSWETGPWEKQSKQQARPCDPWTCACLPPQWWRHRSAAVSAGRSCYSGWCLHAQANGNSQHSHPYFYYRKIKIKHFLLFGIVRLCFPVSCMSLPLVPKYGPSCFLFVMSSVSPSRLSWLCSRCVELALSIYSLLCPMFAVSC